MSPSLLTAAKADSLALPTPATRRRLNEMCFILQWRLIGPATATERLARSATPGGMRPSSETVAGIVFTSERILLDSNDVLDAIRIVTGGRLD